MPETLGRASDLPPLPTHRVKILIVEDNPVTAEFLKDRLAEMPGLQADFVVRDRLASALPVLDQQQVDLVFLDLLLPDSMGIDTFARVQAAHPRVPKIVMSALEEDAVRDNLEASGAPYFLSKSTGGLERLQSVLRLALGRPWAPAGSTQTYAHATSLRTAELDGSTDGVIIFGKGWDVRYSNPASKGLLGAATARELAALIFDSVEIQELFVKRQGAMGNGLVRVTLGSAEVDGEMAHVLTLRSVGSQRPAAP